MARELDGKRQPVGTVHRRTELHLARCARPFGARPFGADPARRGGFLLVANEAMANAIRELSTARGHDPRDHALLAFGGAAGQHACGVAAHLGVTRVVAHPMASVLSAYGIAQARRTALRAALERVGGEDAREIADAWKL